MEKSEDWDYQNIHNILNISYEKINDTIIKFSNNNSELLEEIKIYFKYIDDLMPRISNLKGFPESKEKIKNKIIDAKNFEQFLDLFIELKVAEILINKNLDITIYPEIINHKDEKKEGDFLIILNDKKIYIEVKRIRETVEMNRLEEFYKKIEQVVSEFQSPYYIEICFDNLNLNLLELIDKDKNLDKKIIEYIKNFIITNHEIEEDKEYYLKEIYKNLGFFKIYKKNDYIKDEKTICEIFMKPIPYTGNENFKFWNEIMKKREQLSKDGYNYIFIWSDSTTHDESSLEYPKVYFLENKVVYQIEDLFNQIDNLHGVILRTKFYSPSKGKNKFKLYLKSLEKSGFDEKLIRNLNEVNDFIIKVFNS